MVKDMVLYQGENLSIAIQGDFWDKFCYKMGITGQPYLGAASYHGVGAYHGDRSSCYPA